jgi:hypothetical protein
MYACVVSIYVPLYIEMEYNQYTLTWYQRVTIHFRIPRAPLVHARRSADSLAWSAAEPIATPDRTPCPASAAADPSPPVGPHGLPALRPSSARSPPSRRVRGARGTRGLPRPWTSRPARSSPPCDTPARRSRTASISPSTPVGPLLLAPRSTRAAGPPLLLAPGSTRAAGPPRLRGPRGLPPRPHFLARRWVSRPPARPRHGRGRCRGPSPRRVRSRP